MYVYENIRMSMYEEHLCSYSSVERCKECEGDEECNE